MAQPGRNIAPLVKGKEDEQEKSRRAQGGRDIRSMLNVTPSVPTEDDSPAARTGQVERSAQRFIESTQDLEAQSLGREVQGTGFEVARDLQTGEPFKRKIRTDPFVASGPDSFNFDESTMGAAATMMQGATLGAGGELTGMLNPGVPGAKQYFDDTRNAFAAENPVAAIGLEAFGAAPWIVGGAVSGAPRAAATLEGAAYGFNEPMMGGEDLVSRTGNATVGAALGRVLGGAGASASNQVVRTKNRLSGAPTIQSVAQDDFGITLTEGQIKQDVGLQGFERDARKGAKGQDAAEVAIQSFKDQEQATLNAGRSLGGDRFSTSNQAAGDFLSGVQGRIQTQQTEITNAYERARGYDAELSAQGARSMPDAVVSGLDGDLLQHLEIDSDGFKQLHPNTSAAIQSVAALGQAGQKRGGLPFEQLETTRRIINNAISASAQNPADKRAAMQLKGSFDKFIDSAVDQKLFSGDDAFIGAYQEARGMRATFAKNWEANKVFKKLIESDATPEMAINFVLGGGRLAGDNQMQVLRQLKTALADDPETVAALQEAYMKKFMRQTEKTFNPKVLRDGLDELLMGKNQSFAEELLDEQQYTQLRKFRSVVDSMIPMDGSVNTSNTGAMIERTRGAVSDLLTGPMRSGPVRLAGRVMGEALGKVGVKTSGARARQQFNPPRGLDTRRIESAPPTNAFTPRASDLPGAQPPRDNAFASKATDAAAVGVVAAPLATGAAEAQSGGQELFNAATQDVHAAQDQVRTAQERVDRIEGDLEMLNDVDADPSDLQRILKRRVNADLAIDGVIGRESQAAIKSLREELRAELDPAREQFEKTQARLTQAQQREIYGQHSDKGGIGAVLQSQASNIGAGVGIGLGLGSRFLNLRGARKKVNAFQAEADGKINTQPIAPKSKTGPNSVHERAANLNEFWRMGGAGESVPFKQSRAGEWLPRANATEPSGLFPKRNAFSEHLDVSDVGWIGGGLFEAKMATQYLGEAKASLTDAQERLAAAEESGNLAAYEKAIQDVRNAEMMIQVFTGAQRVGLGLSGMHTMGALKSKYPSARPDIGAAEQEAGLVRRGIAARKKQ